MTENSPSFSVGVVMWRAMYNAWKDLQLAEFTEAEQETFGYMVRPEFSEDGVTGWQLYQLPRAVAYRYATDELRAWWEEHPRTTLAEFEKMWDTLDDKLPGCAYCGN